MPSFPTPRLAGACLIATLAMPVGAAPLDLPAQPLDQAVTELARQTGLTIGGDAGLLRGHRAPALNGDYAPLDALRLLLAGTDVSFRVTGDDSVILEQGNTLEAVEVNGEAKRAGLAPVYGYVARQSITATKSNVALKETPQSVSVVTREQIENQNAQTLDQALAYTPGVQSLTGGANSTTSDGLQIRGFNVTGSSPFYLNGAKLARNTFSTTVEPYGMERIELLRGPASILYGAAAPGGVVNMVTKLPTREPLREIRLQGGSHDRRQLAADVSGPLTDDGALAYRVTGLTRDSDSMVDHIPDDRDFLQGALSWQPTDATRLTVFATYQKNDTTYVYGLPAAGTVQPNPNGRIDRDRFTGEPGFNEFVSESYTLGYLLNHRVSDNWTFRQNALYFTADADYADIFVGGYAADQRTVTRGAYARQDDNHSWSLDNQLEGIFDLGRVRHTVLFGVDYNEQSFAREQYSGTVAPLDLYAPVYGSPVVLGNAPITDYESDNQQLGFYAQDHIKVDDRWVILLGGRYDRFDNEQRDRLTGDRATTYDDSTFTGRAGLVYLFDNGWAPYLSYSQSFEPVESSTGVNYDPTEGEQYEAGLRYAPDNRNLSATLSVYDLTQQNVLTTAPTGGPQIQEGEVRSRGAELEARAEFDNGLSLIAGYAYTNAEVTKSNNGNQGNEPGAVPEHSASLWADYRFGGALSNLNVGAGARYIGSSFDLGNTVRVPDYTVYDALVGYWLNDWRLALNVQNLTDEDYATCTYLCFYGQERTYTATVTYRW
ncbi:MAG: TonB-dependent siderophore receptor [Alcanivorax sp.]|nr:TonB-dependent siderophore receptor [Alcanivorax sp.]